MSLLSAQHGALGLPGKEAPACRSCGAGLTRTLVDLGEQPLANSYLRPGEEAAEARYPLHARVCDECFLVQVSHAVAPETVFADYAYFSSYSSTWVEHTRRFAEAARAEFGLGASSLVVEVASNDGCLLRHFRAAGVPVLGVEPAANVAEVARAAGVPTEVRFFGAEAAADLVARGATADLVVANNVLAHVPDLNGFVAGLVRVLAPEGVVSIEAPHLAKLLEQVQFDTIYHEHFSYFSLLSAERVLGAHGLRVFDVEELPTHGGSLRIKACHAGAARPSTAAVDRVRDAEALARLGRPETYDAFAPRVEACRASLRAFLDRARLTGKTVAAYGAAAKGNTLLNHCGVTTADVAYVVDRNPHKVGRLLPGSHLPVHDVDHVRRTRPDYVLVLPWNWKDEIVAQMADVSSWGGRFVTAVPTVTVLG